MAFWSLILCCLAAFALLTALDDLGLLRSLANITTHGKVTRIEDIREIAGIAENVRWWILALPIIALLIRWIPFGPRGQEGKPPPRNGRAFPCPPFVVGLFALQLCIGAGFLTGTWSYIRERFWTPVPESMDQIRNASLPRGALPISRRLAKILPPDAKVYVVTDPGESPIFLNYYLYPRRFYGTDSNIGFVEQANQQEFWEKLRKEGYRWVLLYRPNVDPAGGGQLIELPPLSKGGGDKGEERPQ